LFCGAVAATGTPPSKAAPLGLLVGVPTIVAPPRTVQVPPLVQPYRLLPAGAVVLKNSWPTLQAAGNAAPTVTGLVKEKAEKSGFWDWVARLTAVDCPAIWLIMRPPARIARSAIVAWTTGMLKSFFIPRKFEVRVHLSAGVP